jgi:hypothetical protein
MRDLKIQFTDKAITAWGGMVLLKNMLRQMDFEQVIRSLDSLPQQGSNRGYNPYTVIESFMTSVWCGANRFIHTEVTRHDQSLGKIFGWERIPAQDVYKRYFSKFTQSINQSVFNQLNKWFFDQLHFNNYTLDFDSTILTRYGNQQGAKRGYNPHKPGRPSHHPLMAFVDDCKMVVNFWLRRGDSHTAARFCEFLDETLERLKDKTVGLVRLDSGFYDKEVFDYLEQKSLSYIVAARFYEPIQRLIASQKTWFKLDEGVDISQSDYQSPLWSKPRRLVIVRQRINVRPKASGKQLKLFEDQMEYNNYRYSCLVTNLNLSSADVWRLYRHRANAENRIKELKYDFGFDSFNMQKFWATEAALNFVMMAYNTMSLFRQVIINSETQQRLSVLKFKAFAIGAYLIKDGNDIVLKLSLALKRREWFTGLWKASRNFSLPVKISNA